MADKKAPGKGEVAIYKFYNVQGDKVTRTKQEDAPAPQGNFHGRP